MRSSDKAVVAGTWAHACIDRCARKILKHDAGIRKKEDPEDIHQMRVALRRLRSAIGGLADVVELPASVSNKSVGKIGRSLGRLRDLDVLLASLNDLYRPWLPAAEQQRLDHVAEVLSARREREVERVRNTLSGERYQQFRSDLREWLAKPVYRPLGDIVIAPLLPNFLLPQISRFLLHPAWLTGVECRAGALHFLDLTDPEALGRLLDSEGLQLHDLRKVAKRTRYLMELFSPFYQGSYLRFLKRIENLQGVLGEFQDAYVLGGELSTVLGKPIAGEMPEMALSLGKTRRQKWEEWTVYQAEFLEDETRRALRQAVENDSVDRGGIDGSR